MRLKNAWDEKKSHGDVSVEMNKEKKKINPEWEKSSHNKLNGFSNSQGYN